MRFSYKAGPAASSRELSQSRVCWGSTAELSQPPPSSKGGTHTRAGVEWTPLGRRLLWRGSAAQQRPAGDELLPPPSAQPCQAQMQARGPLESQDPAHNTPADPPGKIRLREPCYTRMPRRGSLRQATVPGAKMCPWNQPRKNLTLAEDLGQSQSRSAKRTALAAALGLPQAIGFAL